MRRSAELLRRGLIPFACAALLPKCGLCLLPGLALLAGGVELCGSGTATEPAWPSWLAGAGGILLLGWLALRVRRRPRQ
ncbi:hypothetical protein ESB00_05665 [Oleiharenicola lentus]|jgi:hypothetical protein|uniref:Uncharacterized protein n=1 Tax=Oleiharenicola lentus TaxID=2508720 RepID=A0A4Q1C8U5_9BACT|nr:hypothetical protein [Oleiharenicola lentus]RXK55385.1 hypothetical protein ESB00_05665 [Oleiharenicola lentus]